MPVRGVSGTCLGRDERRAFDMLDAQLVDETGRKDTTSKGTAENIAELSVETADTHVAKLEIRVDDGVGGRTSRFVRYATWTCLRSYRFELAFSCNRVPASLTNVA
jgi:hypothetical protein